MSFWAMPSAEGRSHQDSLAGASATRDTGDIPKECQQDEYSEPAWHTTTQTTKFQKNRSIVESLGPQLDFDVSSLLTIIW
jgi:hypothetical protein